MRRSAAAAERVPGLAPQSLVDVGGGTGAAAWAAAAVFGESLKELTVLDQVPEALELGRGLARDAFSGALRHTEWRQVRFPAEVPGADLVTVSYVLSELAPDAQEALVRASAAGAETIAVIEPGTPDGYQRIMAARDVLIGLGLQIAAPCPHSEACPCWDRGLVPLRLAHPPHAAASTPQGCGPAARGREIRLCRGEPRPYGGVAGADPAASADPQGTGHDAALPPDGTVAQTLVSKRQGETYRAARDADWGDEWLPAGDAGSVGELDGE